MKFSVLKRILNYFHNFFKKKINKEIEDLVHEINIICKVYLNDPKH
jgi:hypothetical protein